MSYLFPALGAAVALAGIDKLVGQRGYVGWSDGQMRAAAAAEVAGGLLMVPSATRRLGAAVVAAASLAVLSSELRHGDGKLAAPRGLVLLAGIAAAVAA